MSIINADCEAFYVEDYDVEIRDGRSIVSPILGHVAAGAQLGVAPKLERDGQISLELVLDVRRVDGSEGWWDLVGQNRRARWGRNSALLVPPDEIQATREETVRAASGVWTTLELTPLVGTDQVLVAAVRASLSN